MQHIKPFARMITSDIVILALSLYEKKLSFQSNGSGLVLANTIGKFLSIFGTTARLIFMILVKSVTVISYLPGYNTTFYIQTCDNKSARTISQNRPD